MRRERTEEQMQGTQTGRLKQRPVARAEESTMIQKLQGRGGGLGSGNQQDIMFPSSRKHFK